VELRGADDGDDGMVEARAKADVTAGPVQSSIEAREGKVRQGKARQGKAKQGKAKSSPVNPGQGCMQHGDGDELTSSMNPYNMRHHDHLILLPAACLLCESAAAALSLLALPLLS